MPDPCQSRGVDRIDNKIQTNGHRLPSARHTQHRWNALLRSQSLARKNSISKQIERLASAEYSVLQRAHYLPTMAVHIKGGIQLNNGDRK